MKEVFHTHTHKKNERRTAQQIIKLFFINENILLACVGIICPRGNLTGWESEGVNQVTPPPTPQKED